MKVPWLRKRTEPMPELVELGKAVEDLKITLLREAILPFYRWLFRVTPLGRWYQEKPKYRDL